MVTDLLSIAFLLSTDVNTPFFEAYAGFVNYLPDTTTEIDEVEGEAEGEAEGETEG